MIQKRVNAFPTMLSPILCSSSPPPTSSLLLLLPISLNTFPSLPFAFANLPSPSLPSHPPHLSAPPTASAPHFSPRICSAARQDAAPTKGLNPERADWLVYEAGDLRVGGRASHNSRLAALAACSATDDCCLQRDRMPRNSTSGSAVAAPCKHSLCLRATTDFLDGSTRACVTFGLQHGGGRSTREPDMASSADRVGHHDVEVLEVQRKQNTLESATAEGHGPSSRMTCSGITYALASAKRRFKVSQRTLWRATTGGAAAREGVDQVRVDGRQTWYFPRALVEENSS